MNKLLRILSLLLAVCLVWSCTAAALADECFETLIQVLTSPSEDLAHVSLGVMPYDLESQPTDLVLLNYNLDTGYLTLSGQSSDGSWHLVWWDDVDSGRGLSIVYTLCCAYPQLAELTDEGHLLAFAIVREDGSDPVYIYSAEMAEAFCTLVRSAQ